MPANAGIQYAVTPKLNGKRRGILDHPLSRMMTSVQDALRAHGAKQPSAEVVIAARAKEETNNA
jgi:hypothetical protein